MHMKRQWRASLEHKVTRTFRNYLHWPLVAGIIANGAK